MCKMTSFYSFKTNAFAPHEVDDGLNLILSTCSTTVTAEQLGARFQKCVSLLMYFFLDKNLTFFFIKDVV